MTGTIHTHTHAQNNLSYCPNVGMHVVRCVPANQVLKSSHSVRKLNTKSTLQTWTATQTAPANAVSVPLHRLTITYHSDSYVIESVPSARHLKLFNIIMCRNIKAKQETGQNILVAVGQVAECGGCSESRSWSKGRHMHYEQRSFMILYPHKCQHGS
jgi:hypothetical protein